MNSSSTPSSNNEDRYLILRISLSIKLYLQYTFSLHQCESLVSDTQLADQCQFWLEGVFLVNHSISPHYLI